MTRTFAHVDEHPFSTEQELYDWHRNNANKLNLSLVNKDKRELRIGVEQLALHSKDTIIFTPFGGVRAEILAEILTGINRLSWRAKLVGSTWIVKAI